MIGHFGMQMAQLMHLFGSIVRKFGSLWKQLIGYTFMQLVYLQWMHDLRTMWVMAKALVGVLGGVMWQVGMRRWSSM